MFPPLQDHTVKERKTLPTDLGEFTIDLNEWSIIGTNGVDGNETTFGGNDGAAIVVKGESGVGAGTTAITVKNDPAAQHGTGPAEIVGGYSCGRGSEAIVDASGNQRLWKLRVKPEEQEQNI